MAQIGQNWPKFFFEFRDQIFRAPSQEALSRENFNISKTRIRQFCARGQKLWSENLQILEPEVHSSVCRACLAEAVGKI